jgi:hypothetical protein
MGWEGGIQGFFFSCSQSYSHEVPTGFPKGSPSSQFVPNSTSILSHTKLHSHVHKLKSWGAHLILSRFLGSEEMFLLGSAQCSKTLVMGQSIWPLPKAFCPLSQHATISYSF